MVEGVEGVEGVVERVEGVVEGERGGGVLLGKIDGPGRALYVETKSTEKDTYAYKSRGGWRGREGWGGTSCVWD